MSGPALALVLVAAVCHAIWNVAARGVRLDGRVFVLAYSLLSAVLMVPASALWFAHASAGGTAPHPTWSWLWAGAVSGLLHTAYGVVLQRGYRQGDLSVVYPVARGVGPLLTLVVAIAVLGERPGTVAVLGAVVVVAGIALLSAPPRAVADAVPGSGVRAGVGWGAATGATIAAYTLWDSHSVDTLAVPPVPYFAVSVVFTALPLLPLLPRLRLSALRRDVVPLVSVAVLSPLAYVLVLEAMRLAPVALVAATRESSIVVGTLVGVLLLGEPGGWRRGIGATVVLAGIAAVALG